LTGLFDYPVFNAGNVSFLQVVFDKPVHLKYDAIALVVSFECVVMLNVPGVPNFAVLAIVLHHAKNLGGDQFIPAAGRGLH